LALPDGGGVLATEREEGDREMVLWRCSRHAASSGQRGLRILEIYLKSGCVHAVLGGDMISMGRLLEKPGPKG
jgi:hypothetical protein